MHAMVIKLGSLLHCNYIGLDRGSKSQTEAIGCYTAQLLIIHYTLNGHFITNTFVVAPPCSWRLWAELI